MVALFHAILKIPGSFYLVPSLCISSNLKINSLFMIAAASSNYDTHISGSRKEEGQRKIDNANSS